MNPYRVKLLDCYLLMITTQMAFACIALEICFLDELKDIEPYKYDEDMEFSRNILKTMKDPAILRIDRFLDDSDMYIDQLRDNNNFLDEELSEREDPPLPAAKEKLDRTNFLKMLVVYFDVELAKQYEQLITELCYLGDEIPITDYTHTENCDDENIKAVAAFYVSSMGLADDIFDKDFYQEMS